jgi:hypothetical protein
MGRCQSWMPCWGCGIRHAGSRIRGRRYGVLRRRYGTKRPCRRAESGATRRTGTQSVMARAGGGRREPDHAAWCGRDRRGFRGGIAARSSVRTSATCSDVRCVAFDIRKKSFSASHRRRTRSPSTNAAETFPSFTRRARSLIHANSSGSTLMVTFRLGTSASYAEEGFM